MALTAALLTSLSQSPAQTVSALSSSDILAAVLSLMHRVNLITGDTPALNSPSLIIVSLGELAAQSVECRATGSSPDPNP